MKRFKRLKQIRLVSALSLIIFAALAFLLYYRLGSLTKGLSGSEVSLSRSLLGWHGIYKNPLFLPLKVVQSIVFHFRHSQFLIRLPSTIFGLLSIFQFSYLVYVWHGKRSAALVSPLFACAAWTLHVSRLASSDVIYLWSIITLLLGYALTQKYPKNIYVWLSNCFIWGLLLTIPGLIWMVIVGLIGQHRYIREVWHLFSKFWQRLASLVLVVLWLPLIVHSLMKKGLRKEWLGLPNHLPNFVHFTKEFVGVFVHLLIRGPEQPQLWLGRAPLLDIFGLVMAITGSYYYLMHSSSNRTKLLAGWLFVAAILIALQGSVSFSLSVPFDYVFIAMGLSYFLHSWFKVFPSNPLARTLGIGLISLAVAVSCLYNLRAYFVAWPNNQTTNQTFSRHLQ
jgi:hypothetical protein